MSYVNRIGSRYGSSTEVAYTELMQELSLTGTGWTTYNVFSLYGIPKNSVVEVFCMNKDQTNQYAVGVRGGDSSLARYLTPSDAPEDTNTGHGYKTYATVNASGYIDAYCANTTYNDVIIVGYWTGVTFTEAFTQISVTADEDAQFIDTSTLTTPFTGLANGIANIVFASGDNAARTFGARNTSSGASRALNLGRSNTPGDVFLSFMTSLDSSGACDIYIEYYVNGYGYYMGAFDSSNLTYVETTYNYSASITADSSWHDLDISAALDQDGRPADIQTFHHTDIASGVRSNGSSLARYIRYDSTSTSYDYGPSMTVNTDASGILEHIFTTGATAYLYVYGYYIPS